MDNRHRPRKRFGQNFLIDPHVVEKIIRSMHPQPGDNLVEIGPGQGVLTEKLLASGAELHAVEIDRDLAALLRQRFAHLGHFTLIEQDVLKVDFDELCSADKPARIIGNLPYNISTPLIFHLLDYLPGILDMLFMLQLEVVDRMSAGPGSKDYGRLSIMTQYFCQVEKLFEVPPQAFAPAPKVTSAIVRLSPRPLASLPLKQSSRLENLVRQAFAQRRKTLRNNLQGILQDTDFSALAIDPGLRPENLSPDDYVRICLWLEAQQGESGSDHDPRSE
jgi:16S rRNA (adenine1518-N6/adenine1519-N6)-dimethyltransferase